jgi:hypothetical protein
LPQHGLIACSLQQSLLTHEEGKRAAERAGRIRAEQQLQQLHLELAALQTQNSHSSGPGRPLVFPLTAIGTLRSCFTSRQVVAHPQPHPLGEAKQLMLPSASQLQDWQQCLSEVSFVLMLPPLLLV